MSLSIHLSTVFKHDLKRIKKRGWDIDLLNDVVEMIRTGVKLPAKFYDHLLTGNWRNRRECHIKPDYLLIYHVENDVLYLDRVGSHSDLDL